MPNDQNDHPTLYCPKCDYNLTGLPANRCPECGTEFDRRQIFWTQPTPYIWREAVWFVCRFPAAFSFTGLLGIIGFFLLPGLLWVLVIISIANATQAARRLAVARASDDPSRSGLRDGTYIFLCGTALVLMQWLLFGAGFTLCFIASRWLLNIDMLY